MKISKTVTELWGIQECLENINQKGITWKLRKSEQSFLCVRHSPDLIHIPIKLPEGTEIWRVKECLEKLIKRA